MSVTTLDPLASFHPAIILWFRTCFGAPSPPQARGWPAIQSGQDTLIAAPTGSGKTLTAFLTCIDALIRQGLDGELRDETQVVYISPLKALSNDVQKNLAQPLAEIGQVLSQMGLEAPEVRVVVRTGDTTSSQRQAMIRKPPHILVTTPESLYILLTSERGRRMLKTTRTVIVDEVHAVAGSKRGSHLALSLERLEALADQRPTRIGLSATQKPIEEIAKLLVGTQGLDAAGNPRCAIVDEGYRRTMDLQMEVPRSPLEAVISHETWEEIYDRLAELIEAERTSLVFVNTRRLAERITFHLSKRLGEQLVMSHHGSLSKEQRLRSEQRLKAGELKVLVATASLELGIDIGGVDLVCQIGSPHAISTLLQRVGRSGHTLTGTPRGRLFPLTRDELVECAALLWRVRQGELDRISIPQKPLDILAQHIVAAVAMEDWDEDALLALCRRAYVYRDLTDEEYRAVVGMLAEGFATRFGRGAAYLHRDGVHGKLRARKGARISAVSSGGAIPDNADYTVILEPQNVHIGTVNEDFAIESMAGDIFQLGASSWRIIRVEPGTVRVADAQGVPPTIPFWLGEAPARTDEVSRAVSELRTHLSQALPDVEAAIAWLNEAAGLDRPAAQQIAEYIAAGLQALGVVPTQETIVLERFFDETGGMQLVVHSPYGSRINKAWGLALRKRFCRTFNNELQAAATEDAIVLSLGPQHSFPLEEVFDYLHPSSARDVLVQALLASPIFATRWRWAASRALAILRQSGGKKIPMPLQRMRSDDLLTAVFPGVTACAENVVGDVELPDHPLVTEAVKDSLTEAMDVDGFLRLVEAINSRSIQLIARDTTEPSPFSHEILSARPYAFLDDAPLEERRTQAVYLRRTLDFQSADELGRLDPDAIRRVKEQAWPEADNIDELHDALLITGYITETEGAPWRALFDELVSVGRAQTLALPSATLWVATERLPLWRALFPDHPYLPPATAAEPAREREDALQEVLRGRLEALGPVTAETCALPLGLTEAEAISALTALEGEGVALRGHFTPDEPALEWCDRRLLARIHRYTIDRLRQEIEPVPPATYMQFLTEWQHLSPDFRLDGSTGLVAVLEQLEGFEIAVGAWDEHILTSRLRHYDPAWLEQLCLSGEVAWARLASPEGSGRRAGVTRSTPIGLVFQENLLLHLALARGSEALSALSGVASEILECLDQRGACFFQELVRRIRQLPSDVEEALRELVAAGRITCDGFAGLLSLTSPARRRIVHANRGRDYSQRRNASPVAPRPPVGRWSLLPTVSPDDAAPDELAEFQARVLLQRYGVVFHQVLLRENNALPWRDLVRVYRRLEARGEIRGGRFVAGFSGEQYALPEAVQHLRATRHHKNTDVLVTVSGADPLNLVGILTPGQRIPALPGNRVVYRNGSPASATVNGQTIDLATVAERWRLEAEQVVSR